MKKKQVLSMLLAAVMTVPVLLSTGCGAKSSGKDNEFKWWINMTDGNGTYYTDYEDNPGIQWIHQQKWDVENGGRSDDGVSLKFSFQAPVAGSEKDNFNTMMGTGEYPDIVDLASSADNSKTWYEEGVALELTEWVEKYCPHYVEFLDKNPEIKALVTETDEDGKTHYYQMSSIKDGNDVPWGGYLYRRDWIVEYAKPTSHVWDWDSVYVKEHGHPAVTPLEKAKADGNMEGWKINEVSEFTSSEGDDPNNDYRDNVIFPSGKDFPYTISDWEWMMEAFKTALTEKGFSEDADAYCTTVMYLGYSPLGDLVSSFGAGTGDWCKDADHNAQFMGDSKQFKTYLECMNHWYEEGWMDTRFETRASDQFFMINMTGQTQGKTGVFYGTGGLAGTAIRATCADPEDQKKAYLMGCPVPVNDVYGGEKELFVTPDAFYQGARYGGNASSIIVTDKAKEKDLAALFTFFDWLYTEEGYMLRCGGLTNEQYESMEFEPDVYEQVGLDAAYSVEGEEDGKIVYKNTFPEGADYTNALRPVRLTVGIETTGSGPGLDYISDKNTVKVLADAQEKWTMYVSTAPMLDLATKFTEAETTENDKIKTLVSDYVAQNLPPLLKNGLSGWDEYIKGFEDFDIDAVTENNQRVLDDVYR